MVFNTYDLLAFRMRFFFVLILSLLLNGCSLFGSYVWLNPAKAKVEQTADKSECLALASIVYGSPEALLSLAKNGSTSPNKGVEADCLVEKGYRRTFTKKNK